MRIYNDLYRGMHQSGIYRRELLDEALEFRANWISCEVYRHNERFTRHIPTDQDVLHLVAINKLLRAKEQGFSVPILEAAEHDLIYRQAQSIAEAMEFPPPEEGGRRISELADSLIECLSARLGVHEDKDGDDLPEILTIEELEAELGYSSAGAFYKACRGL